MESQGAGHIAGPAGFCDLCGQIAFCYAKDLPRACSKFQKTGISISLDRKHWQVMGTANGIAIYANMPICQSGLHTTDIKPGSQHGNSTIPFLAHVAGDSFRSSLELLSKDETLSSSMERLPITC